MTKLTKNSRKLQVEDYSYKTGWVYVEIHDELKDSWELICDRKLYDWYAEQGYHILEGNMLGVDPNGEPVFGPDVTIDYETFCECLRKSEIDKSYLEEYLNEQS